MRYIIFIATVAFNLLAVGLGYYLREDYYLLLILGIPLFIIGTHDFFQNKRTILKNFPIIGHFRYMFEMIRPEIQQYFVESDIDGKPFNREQRSLVYQRAKKATDTLPFGTKRDQYADNYEWLNHSMAPKELKHQDHRVLVGNKDCQQPYACSLLNISAMSYGSLSGNAVESLNWGAKEGGFAHNTGEGGISPYHLKHGGDLIWQIGTGYFGCRTPEGTFNPDMFKERVANESVKMIEIKLSQGAKPGHGGILPGQKVTPEVAEIRGVEIGKTVFSPPGHNKFSTPRGLVEFIKELRELSEGKPIGFKICIGRRSEFFGVCKAMIEMDTYPDFISVDGSEGGTGAAPLEFSNSIGMPLKDGLSFVHSALTALGIRQHIKIFASGRIISGFDMVTKFALGADICYSARAMMFSLGCIQALRCNSNDCPAGVATQEKSLESGLVVEDKYKRVTNFHENTIHSMLEMVGAAGLNSPHDIKPYHIQKRFNTREIKHYGEIYTILTEGAFERGDAPDVWQKSWEKSSPDHFMA